MVARGQVGYRLVVSSACTRDQHFTRHLLLLFSAARSRWRSRRFGVTGFIQANLRTSRDSRRGHGINARWWWGLPVGTGRGSNVALDAKPERIASCIITARLDLRQAGLFDLPGRDCTQSTEVRK